MLSQTVEYALRAMVCLASLEPDEAITSEVIAKRTKVPRGYLSKVLRDLVVAELIDSQRGRKGGFCLARVSTRISILDVIRAVDSIPRIRKCPLGNPAHVQLCPLHRRLDDAIALVEREFERTSLAEVLDTNARTRSSCVALQLPTIRKTG